MSNLSIFDFRKPIEKSIEAEKENFNIQFSEIVALVESEQFENALTLIKKAFEENIFDIRILNYFFYIEVKDNVIEKVNELFTTLIYLLENSINKVSPFQKKDLHIKNSLFWLFSIIIRKINYNEKNETSKSFFSNKNNIENYKKGILNARALYKILSKKFEKAACIEKLLYLIKILESLAERYIKKAKEQKEVEIEKKSPKPVKKAAIESPSPSYTDKMGLLVKKLEAFEMLIEQKDYKKAALVSDDITHRLENFDPLEYFPKVFSSYFAILAKNIDIISKRWQEKESPNWKILKMLYQSDLEIFLEWKDEK